MFFCLSPCPAAIGWAIRESDEAQQQLPPARLDCSSTQPGQNKHLPHSLLCWHDMNVCGGAAGVCGLQWPHVYLKYLCACIFVCMCLCVCLHNQLGQSETRKLLNYIFIFLYFPLLRLNQPPTPRATCRRPESPLLGLCPLKTALVHWPHLCQCLQFSLCSVTF